MLLDGASKKHVGFDGYSVKWEITSTVERYNMMHYFLNIMHFNNSASDNCDFHNLQNNQSWQIRFQNLCTLYIMDGF